MKETIMLLLRPTRRLAVSVTLSMTGICFVPGCSKLENLKIEREWRQATRDNSVDAYRAFFRMYPSDKRADEAKRKVVALGLEASYKGDESSEYAEQLLRAVLEVEPNHPIALNNLAVGFALRGQWDEALTYFRLAHENAGDTMVDGIAKGRMIERNNKLERIGSFEPPRIRPIMPGTEANKAKEMEKLLAPASLKEWIAQNIEAVSGK